MTRKFSHASGSTKWPTACKRRVPELTDLSGESAKTVAMYGKDVTTPGTSRRELSVGSTIGRTRRSLHSAVSSWLGSALQFAPVISVCSAATSTSPRQALLADLKQRGLLNDTLIVWGGEFGRTAYSQGKLSATDYGRDHHGRCFTMWMAGGGIRPGVSYGETDELCYNIVDNPVHVHDLKRAPSCGAWASITSS